MAIKDSGGKRVNQKSAGIADPLCTGQSWQLVQINVDDGVDTLQHYNEMLAIFKNVMKVIYDDAHAFAVKYTGNPLYTMTLQGTKSLTHYALRGAVHDNISIPLQILNDLAQQNRKPT